MPSLKPIDRAILLCSAILLALMCAASPAGAQTESFTARHVQDFNSGWRFSLGDTSGAEQSSFNDHDWQPVTVPHDWSIAGPVDQTNRTGGAGGFFPNGIGWYRKSFTLPAAEQQRRVFIVFDGVMANSDVWINGFPLGHRPNGAVSFFYDLTGHLNATGPNILAVKCDNSQQPASRWYEGAGIYRAVRLVTVDGLHFDPWSVVVTTPTIAADKAVVHVQATIRNELEHRIPTNAQLSVTLFAPDGSRAATLAGKPVVVPDTGTLDVSLDLPIKAPQLWNLDRPTQYRAVVQLESGKIVHDDEVVSFGIREFHFDPNQGFFLNGRNFKLYGAALHIDGGAVGIAVPAAVYESRLLALKALGVNAIRTAHNPPSPEFLDLCDRLGLLVMDEMFDAWTVGKEPFDYHLYFRDWSVRDLTDTVRRDRNHPSIILWSAGNEIHDTPHPEIAKPILASLVAAFHANDPTRPVTQALFRPNVSHDYDNGLADMLDVIGQNYRENEILAAHDAKPTRKIVGTENTHDRNQWVAMRDHPAYSGQFLWTGIDYLGEAGRWPLIGSGSGLLSRTLRLNPHGLERESWWSPHPVVHIVRRVAPPVKSPTDPGYEPVPTRAPITALADWTPAETSPHTETVEVYSNGDETDLLLNGKSLGRQKLHADASPLTWQVPFAPGTLRAVTYRQGKPVAQEELHTASAPTHIVLRPARNVVSSSASDLVAIEASVQDDAGVVVPTTTSSLHFSVSGPGVLVATDNGSNTDHTPFPSSDLPVFQGYATVYVRASASSGSILVAASGDGLHPAAISLRATSVSALPSLPQHSF